MERSSFSWLSRQLSVLNLRSDTARSFLQCSKCYLRTSWKHDYIILTGWWVWWSFSFLLVWLQNWKEKHSFYLLSIPLNNRWLHRLISHNSQLWVTMWYFLLNDCIECSNSDQYVLCCSVPTKIKCLYVFLAGPANEENFFEWEALIMWVQTTAHMLCHHEIWQLTIQVQYEVAIFFRSTNMSAEMNFWGFSNNNKLINIPIKIEIFPFSCF